MPHALKTWVTSFSRGSWRCIVQHEEDRSYIPIHFHKCTGDPLHSLEFSKGRPFTFITGLHTFFDMTINDTGVEVGYGAPAVPEPLAVIGMACRLPGESTSPHALWEFLKRGGIANNTPPPSRFGTKHHDGSKKPKTMRSPGGMFLENVDVADFDAQFFGISRTDAIAMDPQQRQLLEVVYECLENSGLSLDDLDGAPVGCFVGSYAVDYADMQARDPEDRAPSVTIGVGRAILSNRISHFLNIKVPQMT